MVNLVGGPGRFFSGDFLVEILHWRKRKEVGGRCSVRTFGAFPREGWRTIRKFIWGYIANPVNAESRSASSREASSSLHIDDDLKNGS